MYDQIRSRTHTFRGLLLLTTSLAALACSFLVPTVSFASGDASASGCPNESLTGFSAALPDCRAFELVTPAYKEVDEAIPYAVAENGSRVVVSSIGSFAGNNATPEPRGSLGVLYELIRDEAGWGVEPVSPENPEYRGAARWDTTSADLSKTLFDMPAAPDGQENYFIREPDGSLTNVGPINPPADGPIQNPGPEGNVKITEDTFDAASANFSHILFSVKRRGWNDPTDPVGADLYEYVGANNTEPTKVAVSNEPGHPLLSLCGADVGGPPFTSGFNGMSEDGNVVFFTPLTRASLGHDATEGCAGTPGPSLYSLYARIDDAETVSLSSPELSEAECGERHETSAECNMPKSDSVFAGAASSGGKVFFLSTEKLAPNAIEDTTPGDSAYEQAEDEGAEVQAKSGCTDAAGSGCNLYEYNFARPPGHRLVTVTVGSPDPHVQGVVRISPDGSHVYFVAHGKLTSSPNGEGKEPIAGDNNLYVFESAAGGEAARTKFIAALAPSEGVAAEARSEDEKLWGTNEGFDTGRPAETTPTGSALVFQSHADLTPDDTSKGVWQIFEYEVEGGPGHNGALKRISIGNEGFNDNGNSDEFSATLGRLPSYLSAGNGSTGKAPVPQFTSISASGSYMFFETSDVLTAEAGSWPGSAYTKIYEYHEGHVYLIYAGPPNTTTLEGTDAEAADVFFESSGEVLTGSGVQQQDLYDARVNGGGAVAPAAVPCAGELCLGAAPMPPVTETPGSVSALAGENLSPLLSPAPVVHPLTVAQKRALALKAAVSACRRKRSRTKRLKCERAAKKRYAPSARGAAAKAVRRRGT
jgi:hypothetical protein